MIHSSRRAAAALTCAGFLRTGQQQRVDAGAEVLCIGIAAQRLRDRREDGEVAAVQAQPARRKAGADAAGVQLLLAMGVWQE